MEVPPGPQARLEIPPCINSHEGVYLQGTSRFWREHPRLTPVTVGETTNQRAFQGWEQGSLLNFQGHLLLSPQALLLPCSSDPF